MSHLIAFVLLVAALTLSGCCAAAPSQSVSTADRVFELRTYICHEGRLDALNARFRDHTNKLFIKHGMQLVGYWMPVDEKDVLIYVIAFPSREAAAASWKAFREDPVWMAAKDASEKDGPIVKQVISKFMTPTDYSLIK